MRKMWLVGAVALVSLGTGTADPTVAAPAPPPVCHGDCNCDGFINFDDINPFVAVLAGEVPCSFANCDVNADGTINFDDINPFVELLASGATCP